MSASGSSRSALERRGDRRISVRLRIQVRGTDRAGRQFEESTESENLCRSGVAFTTRNEVGLGADLEITIPNIQPGRELGRDFSTRARVVHVAAAPDPQKQIVGAVFTGPRFYRVFVSESSA